MEKIKAGENKFVESKDLGFGYEKERSTGNFFIKEKNSKRQVIEDIEEGKKLVKTVYPDLPHIVPPSKIIEVKVNGKKEFAEYTMKIDFRGFITAGTMYASEEFCEFLRNNKDVANEIMLFIRATKMVISGHLEVKSLPEFWSYGNFGIGFDGHLRIVDYHQFSIKDIPMDAVMFCINYEYLLDSETKSKLTISKKILNDPFYKKYLFSKIKPPSVNGVGIFLKNLYTETFGGNYINLDTHEKEAK